MRNNVKTRDLKTHCFDSQTFCFDMDVHCWCSEWMCWRSAERGRACAEYSQRIIPHYLPTVNRYCEVVFHSEKGLG